MTTRTYALIAGTIGSAVAAWWWMRNQAHETAHYDRGRVIFDNTPTATAGADLDLSAPASIRE